MCYTVLYDSEDGKVRMGETFSRPLSMFLSEVDKTKYPTSPQKYHFEDASVKYNDKYPCNSVLIAHEIARVVGLYRTM